MQITDQASFSFNAASYRIFRMILNDEIPPMIKSSLVRGSEILEPIEYLKLCVRHLNDLYHKAQIAESSLNHYEKACAIIKKDENFDETLITFLNLQSSEYKENLELLIKEINKIPGEFDISGDASDA